MHHCKHLNTHFIQWGKLGDRDKIWVSYPRKCCTTWVFTSSMGVSSHAGNRKERLRLTCSKAGTWGTCTRTARWKLQAACSAVE